MTKGSVFFILLVLISLLQGVEVDIIEQTYKLGSLVFGSMVKVMKSEGIRNEEGNIEPQKDVIGNNELVKFYGEEATVCNTYKKKHENLIKILDNYIQRYVSLLLVTSNLFEYKISNFNEIVKADLEVIITGEDLAFLQGFSKSKRQPSENFNLSSLSRLDSIITKIIKLKEKTFTESALTYTNFFSFSMLSSSKLFNNTYFYYILSFFIILGVTVSVFHYSNRKSLWILILLNSMILWESLLTYWRKLREKDIEIYVQTLQFKEIPKDCDLTTLSWFQRAVNHIMGSNCLQYYKEISRIPMEEVTLFRVIFDTYCVYIFQAPSKILGSSLKDFIGELSNHFPFPFNYVAYMPLVFIIIIIGCLAILIFCGVTFRTSWFGGAAAIEVERSKPVPLRGSTSDSIRKPVRDSKKLKALTKTKSIVRPLGYRGLKMKKCSTCKSLTSVAPNRDIVGDNWETESI